MLKPIPLLTALTLCTAAALTADSLTAERDRLLSPDVISSIRVQDPLLAQWLSDQRRITDNLDQARQADPNRAASLTADYQFLLLQYRQELDHFRNAPPLDRQHALNVRDFHAVGDGTVDDGPAIRNAINAALATDGPRAVFIPKGCYKLGYDPKAPGKNLFFKALRHLLVFGEDGTELLIPQPLAVAVQLEDCDDIRLENLRLTYTHRPFTTGVILERIGTDTIRCRIDDGMPSPAEPMFTEAQFKGLFRFYSPELLPNSKRPARSSVAAHQSAPTITRVDGQIVDFQLHQFLPLGKGYAPGLRFAYYARTYGNHAIGNYNSSRTRLVNIRLNSSSAMAICNIHAERPFIANCTVEADPDTYISTCADGIYLRGLSLGGLLLNNTIRHIGDDFINIHSLLSPAFDGTGNTLILKKQWPPQHLRVGARLGLIPVSRGYNEPLLEARITALTEQPDTWKVTLDNSFGDLVTRQTCAKNPKIKKADFLVLLDNQCHGLVIRGNRFEHGLSRFLAGGRNWLFTENTIEDSLNNVYFMNLCSEAQGPENAEFVLPRNVEISHNRFRSLAKILFRFGGTANQFVRLPADAVNASHVRITDNTFDIYGSSSRPLIDQSHTEFLTIENNITVHAKRK